MKIQAFITTLLFVTAHTRSADTSKDKISDDNLLQNLLNADDEDSIKNFFDQGKNRVKEVKKEKEPRKKTILVTAKIPIINESSKKEDNENKIKNKKNKLIVNPQETGKDIVSKSVSENAASAAVQPELTFETPTSAAFLLKPLPEKPKIYFKENEIKEVEDYLNEIDSYVAKIKEEKTKIDNILTKSKNKKEVNKDKKPATDLLNYNFIEVTETGAGSEKK